MFGFGHILELVIVLILALLFLGPKRIPEIASGLGKGIREFRRTKNEDPESITDEMRAELPAAARHDALTRHSAAMYAATPSRGDTEPRSQ